MISAVKYLYKYIYKGADRARINVESEADAGGNDNVDEIKQHLNTRYGCAPQSIYRIFGFEMQEKSHTVCSTFAEAAKRAGFLDDDRYFRQSLEEAIHYQSAACIRSFFACLLCFCEVVQAQDLWDEFADAMSDDYISRGFDRELAVAFAYFDILDRMALIGKDLREIVSPPVAERPVAPTLAVNHEEQMVGSDVKVSIRKPNTFYETPAKGGSRTGGSGHDNLGRNLAPKAALEAVDVLLKDIMQNDEPFGGKVIDNPQDERTYKSIDEAIYHEGQGEQLFQQEYLNSLTPTGMPPHELRLKKGAIVMLLRNLDVTNGLCNGTRLKVETLRRFTLGCKFICGERRGQLAIIPRIDNYWDKRAPFRLRRRQFPIRVAFAMTINKAQGQSFNKVGVYLPEEVFGWTSHDINKHKGSLQQVGVYLRNMLLYHCTINTWLCAGENPNGIKIIARSYILQCKTHSAITTEENWPVKKVTKYNTQ
ncbi:hypothetical protein OSTOST_20459 [Ostertagia ostertagi]